MYIYKSPVDDLALFGDSNKLLQVFRIRKFLRNLQVRLHL